VTAAFVVIAWAGIAGSLLLMFHPLLRHLKLREVPVAVAALFLGRRYRRRLALILKARQLRGGPGRAVLTWDRTVARLHGWWQAQAAPSPRRVPAAIGPRAGYPVADEAHLEQAMERLARSGELAAATRVYRRRRGGVSSASARIAAGRDWRDGLPEPRNPWAAPVERELAAHRRGDAEFWESVARNWKDVR
jgi:hypothetical protein